MLSKNNHLMKQRLISNAATHQRFGLRKLSIGVASVLLSTTFFLGAQDAAHADTPAPANEAVASSTADANAQNRGGNTVTISPANSANPASTSANSDFSDSSASNENVTSSESTATPVSNSSQNSTSATTFAASKPAAAPAPASETPAEQASATIVYREGSDEVGNDTISGTVGQTVDLTLNAPSGYSLVPGVTVPSTYTFTNASKQYIYIPVVAPDHTVVHAGETKSIDFTFNYEKVKVNYNANGLPTGVEDDGRLGTNNDSIKLTYTYTGDVLDASGNVVLGGNWDFTSVENNLAEDPHGNDPSSMNSWSGTELLNHDGGKGIAFGPVGSNSYYGWTIGPNISKSELSHYYLLGRLNPYSFSSSLSNLNVTFYSGYQLQFNNSTFDYQSGHDLPDTISFTVKYLENPSVIAINTNGEIIKTLSPIQLTGDEGSEVMVDDGGTSGVANSSADVSQWAGYSRIPVIPAVTRILLFSALVKITILLM